MTIKFRNFDWGVIALGIFMAVVITMFTFLISWGLFQIGLTNYFEQTVMANYTQYTLPIDVEAYYQAAAWKTGAIYSGVLSLIVFFSIVIFFIILSIIDAIHTE